MRDFSATLTRIRHTSDRRQGRAKTHSTGRRVAGSEAAQGRVRLPSQAEGMRRRAEKRVNKDQVSGKVEQTVGKAKQSVGEALGNDKLANQGVVDQAKGAAKETWGNAKDTAKQVQHSHQNVAADKAHERRGTRSVSPCKTPRRRPTKRCRGPSPLLPYGVWGSRSCHQRVHGFKKEGGEEGEEEEETLAGMNCGGDSADSAIASFSAVGFVCDSRSGLFQFRHGQSPESVSHWKAVRRAADDRAGGNPRLAHHLAHEIEVHCVAGRRYFGPLRFKQFQTSADVHHEVHLAGAVTPEEQATHPSGAALALSQLGEDERFPDRACPRRLTKSFLGADVQQRTKQAGIRQVEFGTLDDGLGAVREPWLEQALSARKPPVRTANGWRWRERCLHLAPDQPCSTSLRNGGHKRAESARNHAGCPRWPATARHVPDRWPDKSCRRPSRRCPGWRAVPENRPARWQFRARFSVAPRESPPRTVFPILRCRPVRPVDSETLFIRVNF